jgi:hypothetical protein
LRAHPRPEINLHVARLFNIAWRGSARATAVAREPLLVELWTRTPRQDFGARVPRELAYMVVIIDALSGCYEASWIAIVDFVTCLFIIAEHLVRGWALARVPSGLVNT